MKGVFLNDIYCLRDGFKQIFIILAIFAVCFANSDTGMAVTIGITISMVLLMNAFAMGEMGGWYRQAMVMPISRQALVLEKYVLAWCLIGAGALFGIAVTAAGAAFGLEGAAKSLESIIPMALVSALAFVLIDDIIIPLYFRFGVNRGRILFVGVGAAAMFIVIMGVDLFDGDGWFQVHLPQLAAFIAKLAAVPGDILAAGAVLVCLALTALSYLLSRRIVEKKEF